MYKCAVNKNEEADVNGYKKVIAISPSQGQIGDYSDGYGTYHYTYLSFDFATIPAITADVLTWINENMSRHGKLLFKAKEAEIVVRTLAELQAE